MASKKNEQAKSSGSLPALKIGSRVRCSDDGVEGRITWANGVSVKVQWDDGEQVTWRRDSLADRPIEILDNASEEESPSVATEPTENEATVSTESTSEEPSLIPLSSDSATATSPPATDAAAALVEPMPPVAEPVEVRMAPSFADATVETPVKAKRQRKAAAVGKEKKLSALDAAAQVLAEAGTAMNCQEMIAVMASKGYWTSPGGKTPHATLYSAILREITVKGAASRFVKSERGQFGRSDAV